MRSGNAAIESGTYKNNILYFSNIVYLYSKNINRTLTYTSACFIEHFLFIAYYYAMFRKRIFPAIFLTFSILSVASFALLRNACTVQNDAVFLASAYGNTAVITDGNMTSVPKTELSELNDIQKNTQAFSKKNNAGAFILYIKNAVSCVPRLKKAEFIGAIMRRLSVQNKYLSSVVKTQTLF